MDVGYYKTLHEIQERHWWYAARRQILSSVLDDEVKKGIPEGKLYDLGCGVGANLPILSRFGKVVGVDGSPEAVKFCHSRGFSDVTLGDLNRLDNLQEGSANVVVLADVIEHLEDEGPCLTAAHRLLAPGGVLLITVPAFMFLWSPADDINHHQRRYTEGSLRSVVGKLFDIERTTYFNSFLFGAVLAGRVVEKLLSRGGDDMAHVPPGPINSILRAVFAAETPFVRKAHLPFGVSILCVARKRD